MTTPPLSPAKTMPPDTDSDAPHSRPPVSPKYRLWSFQPIPFPNVWALSYSFFFTLLASLPLFCLLCYRLWYTHHVSPDDPMNVGAASFTEPVVVELLVASALGCLAWFARISRFGNDEVTYVRTGMTFMLWVAYTGGAVAASVLWGNLSTCWNHPACRLVSAIIGFAWTGAILTTISFVFTLILLIERIKTGRGAYRGPYWFETISDIYGFWTNVFMTILGLISVPLCAFTSYRIWYTTHLQAPPDDPVEPGRSRFVEPIMVVLLVSSALVVFRSMADFLFEFLQWCHSMSERLRMNSEEPPSRLKDRLEPMWERISAYPYLSVPYAILYYVGLHLCVVLYLVGAIYLSVKHGNLSWCLNTISCQTVAAIIALTWTGWVLAVLRTGVEMAGFCWALSHCGHRR